MRKLYARMWWCEDYECDCTEPEIVESGWNELYPKLLRVVESAHFHSQATHEETDEQWKWLLEAARRHNVENLSAIEQECESRCIQPTTPESVERKERE